MKNNWTFGRRLAVGLMAVVGIAVVIGVVAVLALRNVVAAKDQVIRVNSQILLNVQRLETNTEGKSAAGRGYLLTANEMFLTKLVAARSEFDSLAQRLRGSFKSDRERQILESVQRAERAHREALSRVIEARRGGLSAADASQAFEDTVVPLRNALDVEIAALLDHEERVLDEARAASSARAEWAIRMVLIFAVIAVAVAAVIGSLLTRNIAMHIGSTVSEVQSSSVQLQTAANEQATGAREHATAMNEISTTISELLATSRQIAESAQRVTHVAEQTAGSARTGEGTVERTYESLEGIRRQIDVVVAHMLDLGRKSQHIGAVLDIVSELAEQTNILAINATIEAAGAGDAGKRFGVVADEIRKLADRVGGSTKEIRSLIDDVRSAVNTTVMATESGSKAVDAGTRQFAEVASAFKEIAGLVSTTTEAAREIELSTKQQTTAVEQVNIAIANITQVTRDTETSSIQTLQTAAQLAELSHGLLRLVQPQKAA
jgi:methyl-accepting chemotaxis protein